MKSNRVAPVQQVVTAQPRQQAVPTQPVLPGQHNEGEPGQLIARQPEQQQVMDGGIAANAQSAKAIRMPEPATRAQNCPPGLAYLTRIDQILIKQRIELIELLTNLEGLNSYRLLNSMGQQIYFAAEESEECMRQCCRENRSFTMHIYDNVGHEVIRLQREFRCWQESNWCAFSDCCAHKIAVEAPVGTVVGYVQQRLSFKAPKYKIMDADENDVFYIEGPCCICDCCRAEVNFTIYSATDGETEVGKIQKQWTNLLQEMYTAADNFSVTFPLELDVKMKAVIIGATILIDFMYFEGHQN